MKTFDIYIHFFTALTFNNDDELNVLCFGMAQ